MNCSATSSWNFLLNFLFHLSSFTLSVNFPNQLVTDMSEPVLNI